MTEVPRAQLIHIDVDRRLGHEWDEWDGKPLPNLGNFDSPPGLFLAWSAVTIGGAVRSCRPRLCFCWLRDSPSRAPPLPGMLWLLLAGVAELVWLWWTAPRLSPAPPALCSPSDSPSADRCCG